MKREKPDGRTNNIDLGVIAESKKMFEAQGGHHRVEKYVEGEYRLEGSPSFAAQVKTDLSGFVLHSDEPKVLGGYGVQPSPLTYVLFGVLACYANSLAIQCSLKGASLRWMKLSGRLTYDIGPLLTDAAFPLIKQLEISVEADKDIRDIIELSNSRCPALYLVNHAVETRVSQLRTRRKK